MDVVNREAKSLNGLGFVIATVVLLGVWLWFVNLAQLVVPLANSGRFSPITSAGMPPLMQMQLSLRGALLANPFGIVAVLVTLTVFTVASARVLKYGQRKKPFLAFCATTNVVLAALITFAVTAQYQVMIELLTTLR